MHHKQGFTLIELLVVMAIIALLVALILPAVQYAREGARRTSCKSNLKQMLLAMQNYESVHESLPPGYLYKPDPAVSGGNQMGFTWGAMILRDIEQEALFKTFNFKLPAFDPANKVARETKLAIFTCPSDPSTGKYVELTPNERYAVGNYVGNWGSASDTENMDVTPTNSKGVFYRNSRIAFRDILDGLSNTLALSERTNGELPPRDNNTPASGNYQTTWCCTARDAVSPENDHAHLALFDTRYRPNQPGSDNKAVSSAHTGMVQIALCDGSVRSISDNISDVIFEGLGTRSGKEAFGEY